ncbi:S41 family peptidase [Candidatus Parcubacteria bacterium]|nr:MAG: S41 family peptidase [Candidatus Parcubacteria bacterium]
MSKKKVLLGVGSLLLLGGVAAGSFIFGTEIGSKYPQELVIRGVSGTETPDGVQGDFGVFWQAWHFINENYLRNEKITDQEKVYGAVRGLVGSLGDPNSVFFSPEEGSKFREDIQGSFSGIGAELGIRNERLTVIAPLKDTPASRAGLLPGDQIFKINSTSTDGITVEKAVTLIRGPENTPVTLSILRKGWEGPQDITIVRAPIIVPTIDFEMKDENIAHFQIHSFNSNVNILFYRAAFEALSAGARGIILDVRGNPGGFLDTAVDLAGWFLPRGKLVVKEATREGTAKEFYASGNSAFADFPVVVLINQGSASASEILAGTLRDNRNVKLVGEQSFGKGTVQQLETLKDGSSLKITIADWVLPKGGALEGVGLRPDIEVERTDEDIQKERDPQLEKALELVRQEINNL